jgi:hypothetical protein
MEPVELSINGLQQPKQKPVARQLLCKHVSSTTEADATVE